MLDPEKQVKHRFFTEKLHRVRFWTEKFTTCVFWEWKNLRIWEESVFEFEKKYVLAAKKHLHTENHILNHFIQSLNNQTLN